MHKQTVINEVSEVLLEQLEALETNLDLQVSCGVIRDNNQQLQYIEQERKRILSKISDAMDSFLLDLSHDNLVPTNLYRGDLFNYDNEVI